MKLLITTQSVDLDDAALGFFHRWLVEFSKQYEEVSVICLKEGRHDLPPNVKIFSLGKEKGAGKVVRTARFFRYIWVLRRGYDAVFVHMNPIYIALGGIFWKASGKHIGLWYTHRQVNALLRVAERLADVVFTASPESFRIKSGKVRVLGHGIDLEKLAYRPHRTSGERIRLLHVGRITRIKNCDVLIEAARILKSAGRDISLVFIGSPATPEDAEYQAALKRQVEEAGLGGDVEFRGSVAHDGIGDVFREADVSVNLCPTGGVDKVVLESMACGTSVLASNRTFAAYFGRYSDRLLFEERNPRDLADKIVDLVSSADVLGISEDLRKEVEARSDIARLVESIKLHLKL
jgi:glycosyltransferase involved in cell wall biosynthesis